MSKQDRTAREVWGKAYGDIPKSVFAMVAASLSAQINGVDDLSSDTALLHVGAEARILSLNGLLDGAQANRALAAIQKIAAVQTHMGDTEDE